MDIHTLLERPSGPASPGNASTSSRDSTSSSVGRDNATTSTQASTVATLGTPAPYAGVQPSINNHHHHQQHHPQPHPQNQLFYHQMQAVQYHQPYMPHSQHYPPPEAGYPGYPHNGMPDPRFPPHIPVTHTAPSNKRLAPPHPAASPAKKKQSKWTADEDASIIELRGNGMKWEDISKHLPGRSAISCRLRFQNYLERRSEWDEEKKNKLARLYERYVDTGSLIIFGAMLTHHRFKKDMWEKISKEMALPWRAAEAMHWQIGEVEMAQRANVPVFHLAGQQTTSTTGGALPDSRSSTSPGSVSSGPALGHGYSHAHTHNHSLPQVSHPMPTSISPEQVRIARRKSGGSSPGAGSLLRHRADSARSCQAAAAYTPRSAPALPPLGEITTPQSRCPLPPVVTSAEAARRY